jgi:pimeloyl-ACP methyl ester carboxylesterase
MVTPSVTSRSRTQFFHGGEVYWEEWAPVGLREGEGKRPAILVHGLSDSCRTWNRIAPSLAKDRRVYALDLPGHGRSERYDASYHVAWYARVVADWIRSLGHEEYDLVGHSLGGGISMRLLFERPGRVNRLVLISAGGLGLEVALPLRLAAVTGMLDQVAPLLMGIGTRAGMRILSEGFDAEDRKHLSEMNARPFTARALSRTLRAGCDMKGQREHILDHVHRLEELPPVAVFWGDRDPVIPVRHAEEVHRYLDGVMVRRYPKAGHYPHREAASEVLPELLRFLDSPQKAPRVRPGARSPRAATTPTTEMKTPFWQRVPGSALVDADETRIHEIIG